MLEDYVAGEWQRQGIEFSNLDVELRFLTAPICCLSTAWGGKNILKALMKCLVHLTYARNSFIKFHLLTG